MERCSEIYVNLLGELQPNNKDYFNQISLINFELEFFHIKIKTIEIF